MIGFRGTLLMLVSLALAGPAVAQGEGTLKPEQTCLEILHHIDDPETIRFGGPKLFYNELGIYISNLPEQTAESTKDILKNARLTGIATPAPDPIYPYCIDSQGYVLELRDRLQAQPTVKVPLRVLTVSNSVPDTIGAENSEVASVVLRTFDDGFAFAHRIGSSRAGSADVSGPTKDNFYRIAPVDPEDITQGVLMLLCVNNCAGVLSTLPAIDPNPLRQPIEQIVQDLATTPEDKAPMPVQIPYADFWNRSIVDLAEPVFLENDQDVPLEFSFSCSTASFKTKALKDVVAEIYSNRCLNVKGGEYRVLSSKIRENSLNTDRLVIEIDVELKRSQYATSFSVLHESDLDVFECQLQVQFAEIKAGQPLDQVSFSGQPIALNQTLNPESHVVSDSAKMRELPAFSRWKSLAVNISAVQSDTNNCRLAAPAKLALRDEAISQNIHIDRDGKVEIKGLELKPAKPNVYIFLNTYLGATDVGTAENNAGVYGFAELREFKNYAIPYLEFVASRETEISPPHEFVIFAPNDAGQHVEIARLTPSVLRSNDRWAQDVLENAERYVVGSEYSDSFVSTKLTDLQNNGDISETSPPSVHIFARSGFETASEFCSDTGFALFRNLDISIVEFTKADKLTDFRDRFRETQLLEGPYLRTYLCDTGFKQGLVLTDSRSIEPTPGELKDLYSQLYETSKLTGDTE